MEEVLTSGSSLAIHGKDRTSNKFDMDTDTETAIAIPYYKPSTILCRSEKISCRILNDRLPVAL